MVALHIDEETFAIWKEKALRVNLSVEDWLKRRIAGEAGYSIPRDDLKFQAWWSSFVSSAQQTGFTLDDSRENIYD